ncbi:type 2 isopentenyl-diphosphate Delta-isomerase [Candidatus Micrarchaeota archaeon]|nr:type 2 isopentenyl-diphosphate Delta-isomerase [Candidatus Micrarchaeota archaeon]
MMPNKTEKRKKDHVEVVLKNNVQFEKTTGLEKIDFVHNALPECDFNKIDMSLKFLGKKISCPIVIEAMTGGYKHAQKINHDLAAVCEKYSIAFGLGSQRAMIEDESLVKTYTVRDTAPSIPLIGNIGAFQLKRYPVEKIENAVSKVEADALAVHLNPLQEAIQPEGDRDFTGILKSIERLCGRLSVPVIAKEVGSGISSSVALGLKDAGVSWIDVAGAGGTSWSKVEHLRNGMVDGFDDWGIPTSESILQCKGILPLIASGGIRSGIDCAKCIVLGAELAGGAYPFLKAWKEKRTGEEVERWITQMKVCAFLTGSKNYSDLRKAEVRIF